jgi:hypothetical protein
MLPTKSELDEQSKEKYVIPCSLADRIIRTAKERKESSEDKIRHETYREWSNSGYSIYNDRG